MKDRETELHGSRLQRPCGWHEGAGLGDLIIGTRSGLLFVVRPWCFGALGIEPEWLNIIPEDTVGGLLL